MGAYVYSLRSPKLIRKVRLDNGNVMTVGVYHFHFKPVSAGFFNPEPRWQRLCWAQIARLEQIWNGFIAKDGAWPQGTTVTYTDPGEKPCVKAGDPVIGWPKRTNLPVSYYDDYNDATSFGKVAEIIF